MYFHEREAHPQAFCRACAAVRGVVRLCDVPGPDAAAIAERVVDELLPPADPEQVRRDVDKVMARVAQLDEERRQQFRQSMAMIGPLGPGDIVGLVIDGEGIPGEVMESIVEDLLEREPSRFDAPVIVVPHGWGARCRELAEVDGLRDIAAAIIEAPAVAEVALLPPLSARERSWFAWFDRDDVSDDELTEMLAEHGASWDEIEGVLDERQRRRDERGDPLLVEVTAPREG
jgi:hypothetical protein